jgi:hypothetical protein
MQIFFDGNETNKENQKRNNIYKKVIKIINALFVRRIFNAF